MSDHSPGVYAITAYGQHEVWVVRVGSLDSQRRSNHTRKAKGASGSVGELILERPQLDDLLSDIENQVVSESKLQARDVQHTAWSGWISTFAAAAWFPCAATIAGPCVTLGGC